MWKKGFASESKHTGKAPGGRQRPALEIKWRVKEMNNIHRHPYKCKSRRLGGPVLYCMGRRARCHRREAAAAGNGAATLKLYGLFVPTFGKRSRVTFRTQVTYLLLVFSESNLILTIQLDQQHPFTCKCRFTHPATVEEREI